MKVLKPEQLMQKIADLEKSLKQAKKAFVKVGLPAEKVGSAIYSKDSSVKIVQVGAIHEYGSKNTPKRSFLREPFMDKEKEINVFITKQFKKIYDGQAVDKSMGLIGAYCTNISRNAFKTSGDGKWEALSPSTVNKKGSSKPLIDTGTLRNAIIWTVNNGS